MKSIIDLAKQAGLTVGTNISDVKLNRIRKLSVTTRYPHTFEARLANIDPELCGSLTAKQIAAIIDGPMQRSYAAGHQRILG